MPSEPDLSDFGPGRNPLVGLVLADRYRLIRRLGRGGMGTVYEGIHLVLGKRVAVKLLHPQLAGDEELVRRFLNEARAAATLGHPNIAEALDTGRAPDGTPFLVMEFLEGETLTDRLDKRGPLAPAATVEMVRAVAKALIVAHGRGIVHRDLKPDNIYLARHAEGGDQVKVLDFGVSKFSGLGEGGATKTGALMGTPAFMAPEQFADSSRADARSDVYALGVVLYRCLSGTLPFVAESLNRLADQTTHEPPPPLDGRVPDLPPPLVLLVHRCLAKDPAARFASMGELLAGLDALGPLSDVSSLPAPAAAPAAAADPRPHSIPERLTTARSPPQRRPEPVAPAVPPAPQGRGRFAVAALLALAALGVGMGLWIRGQDTRSKPSPLPATEARLTLESNVPVTVFLNEAPVGATPLRDHPVQAGKLSVRLTNDEVGLDRRFELEVAPGNPVIRREEFSVGRVALVPDHGEAEVFRGASHLGKIPGPPFLLFAGPQDLDVRTEAGDPLTTVKVTVAAGQVTTVNVARGGPPLPVVASKAAAPPTEAPSISARSRKPKPAAVPTSPAATAKPPTPAAPMLGVLHAAGATYPIHQLHEHVSLSHVGPLTVDLELSVSGSQASAQLHSTPSAQVVVNEGESFSTKNGGVPLTLGPVPVRLELQHGEDAPTRLVLDFVAASN